MPAGEAVNANYTELLADYSRRANQKYKTQAQNNINRQVEILLLRFVYHNFGKVATRVTSCSDLGPANCNPVSTAQWVDLDVDIRYLTRCWNPDLLQPSDGYIVD